MAKKPVNIKNLMKNKKKSNLINIINLTKRACFLKK